MLGPLRASWTSPIPKRRAASFLVAWSLTPVCIPSPPSHQSCLSGITTGPAGTSEGQFVPPVPCPHQMRPVGFSWGHPESTSAEALAPQRSGAWYLSGAFRLWLSVTEVVPERLYRNCGFHGMLTLR